MTIDNLTIKEARELAALFSSAPNKEHPYQIGKNYFIRTVTFHYTGRLVRVTDQELVLEEASWIADDGRFSEAIATGALNEIEPYGDDDEVIIGRGAVVDAVIWRHKLPRERK